MCKMVRTEMAKFPYDQAYKNLIQDCMRTFSTYIIHNVCKTESEAIR
jgi:hypothetical protein